MFEHDAYSVWIDEQGRVVLGLGPEGERATEAIRLCPCHGALDLAREIQTAARQGVELVPAHAGNRAYRRAQRRRGHG